MIVTPEIDLTPESASSLAAFERLFWSGRFYMLANVATLASTDIQTLYRAMDRLVSRASLSNLCASPAPMTPAERIAAAKAAADELRALGEQVRAKVLEWYASQPADVQAAVLALVVSLRMWAASVYDSMSVEAQAVLASLQVLLTTIAGEMATVQAGKRATNGAVRGQA